ncbi:phosphoribosyltransferase [uncultured Eudoraea sp.]|uniref:phosphoribosyltransferase n=1 Tax=uncultured Eudoraea sp. TaxID=1035614 RepID=UPI00262E9515|nr:phosphoribosyltransferase family protein [uncultured Eudoraea sp.]
MFKDRIDAGIQLANKLLPFKDKEVVVLAIPRGGLPIGAIVAKALQAPLDVALSKKIGHPYNREYAIGAVSLENIILKDVSGIHKNYIAEETERIREKLKKRHQQYYKNRQPEDLKDKIVIIIDDGIATGNTIRVTAEMVRAQKPKKVIVAIPVAPPSAVKSLEDSSYIDQVICLQTPSDFMAVGQFYEFFNQVSDEEAIQLLEECNVA